jgi:hypothetical protein
MILFLHEARARPLQEDRTLYGRPTRHMNVAHPVTTHLVHNRALATVLLLVRLGDTVRLAVDIVHLGTGPVTSVLGSLCAGLLGTLTALDHGVRTTLCSAVLVLDGGVSAESTLGVTDGVSELASVCGDAAHLILGVLGDMFVSARNASLKDGGLVGAGHAAALGVELVARGRLVNCKGALISATLEC